MVRRQESILGTEGLRISPGGGGSHQLHTNPFQKIPKRRLLPNSSSRPVLPKPDENVRKASGYLALSVCVSLFIFVLSFFYCCSQQPFPLLNHQNKFLFPQSHLYTPIIPAVGKELQVRSYTERHDPVWDKTKSQSAAMKPLIHVFYDVILYDVIAFPFALSQWEERGRLFLSWPSMLLCSWAELAGRALHSPHGSLYL